jgi:hypothetical protein
MAVIGSGFEVGGSIVAVVLAILLLTKEMLASSGKETRLLRLSLTALIVPLLALFAIQIIFLLFTSAK